MEEEAGMEDIHGIVLNSVFNSMKMNPNKLLVNTEDNLELTLNRNLLVLFSPFLRSILGSIPCCTESTMFLPDINTRTIIKLRDILNNGTGANFLDLNESGDILEAARVLGIDMTKLYYGAEKISKSSGEVTVHVDRIGNKSKQMKKIFDLKKIEGKEVVFINKTRDKLISSEVLNIPADGKAAEYSATINNKAASKILKNDELNKDTSTAGDSQKSAGLRGTASLSTPGKGSDNVQKIMEVKRETNVDEDQNANNSLEPIDVNQSDNGARSNPLTVESQTLRYRCERCNKGFTSLTLLRYHYCAHFRTLLKKRFASLYDRDKCLVCMKTFSNPGKLLLHIGIYHDKINEILKSKGISEIPSYIASSTLDDGMEPPTETDDAFHDEDADKNDIGSSVYQNPTQDEKNISLLPATISTPLIAEEQSTSTLMSKSTPASSTTSKIPETFAPTTALETSNSLIEKQDTGSECNYDLECKVCDQKVKTISLLEQHCCRHFMKELQEQYGSLMDGLKCTICHSIFKQKHSLVLHIGCKHGKINVILRKKGYGALPCPVANSSVVMQKQLEQVKQEKLEMDDMTDNHVKFRKQIAREESSDTLDNAVSHSETTTSPLPTLDDILKKYQVLP